MKLSLPIKVVLTLSLIFVTLYRNIIQVSAETSTTTTQPIHVVVRVNELDQLNIKTELIERLINYDLYPELVDNIDYDQSTISLKNFDVSTVGTQEVLVKLVVKTKSLLENSLFKNTINTTIIVEVIDEIAPRIAPITDTIKTSIGGEVNFLDYVEITDNSSEDLQVSYTTDFDSTVAGDYQIEYIALDSSKNTTKLTLPIIVKAQDFTDYGTDEDLIYSMLSVINDYRAEKGLNQLELGDTNAQTSAGIRAAEAAYNLSHTRPNGKSYTTCFDDYEIEYNISIEIITTAGSTVEDKLNWWKNSPDHNSRLIDPKAEKIAIGYKDKVWVALLYYE